MKIKTAFPEAPKFRSDRQHCVRVTSRIGLRIILHTRLFFSDLDCFKDSVWMYLFQSRFHQWLLCRREGFIKESRDFLDQLRDS